jgi:hypothetical protein
MVVFDETLTPGKAARMPDRVIDHFLDFLG